MKFKDLITPSNLFGRFKNTGYSESGASRTKKALKGYNARSSSVHEDIDYNNQVLRERGRDLFMSTPIARSAINTVRTNTVGTGLQLRSSIDRVTLGMSVEQAEEWQKKTEMEFALWADNSKNCDATGMNNFYELQQLALVSWLISGDCFALIQTKKASRLKPYSLRLRLIESDRCRTPVSNWGRVTTAIADNGNLIFDGVEVDKDGAVVAYHFSNRHPYEYSIEQMPKGEEWTRVKACSQKTGLPNVIHMMSSERPDQYRGITFLAPVIEQLRQLGRYTDAELTAAVIESFFTAFIKTEANPDIMPFNQTDEDDDLDLEPNDYAMGPGQINVMAPGEDVIFGDPKRPAGGFDPFVKAISSQIGAALEIPADLLLKQFNSSYSASRAALMEAWKSFNMRRKWLIDDFCKPVYEVWLSEAVALGRIQAPGFFSDPLIHQAYLGADWIGPSQGQLDPVKEVTAEILACSEGFSTHEQSTTKLNGGQWDQNIERLTLETQKLHGQSPDPHQSGETASGNEQLKAMVMESLFKGGVDDT